MSTVEHGERTPQHITIHRISKRFGFAAPDAGCGDFIARRTRRLQQTHQKITGSIAHWSLLDTNASLQQRTIEYTNYETTPTLRNAIATPAIDTRWMSRPVATARSV